MFDAKKIKSDVVNWIKEYFDENGKDSVAVVGVSGGVDSSVVLALCVEAIGSERVLGVTMPVGENIREDSSCVDALKLCEHLNVECVAIAIRDFNLSIQNVIKDELSSFDAKKNEVRLSINTPARVRGSILYNVSDYIGGRVANTCNLSEDYIGYNTKFGDIVGDFAPLVNLTKIEVFLLAKELDIPDCLANKIPEDGLTGLTDEENFGFSYEVLDGYIRSGEIEDLDIKLKIDKMHKYSRHKIEESHKFIMTISK